MDKRRTREDAVFLFPTSLYTSSILKVFSFASWEYPTITNTSLIFAIISLNIKEFYHTIKSIFIISLILSYYSSYVKKFIKILKYIFIKHLWKIPTIYSVNSTLPIFEFKFHLKIPHRYVSVYGFWHFRLSRQLGCNLGNPLK